MAFTLVDSLEVPKAYVRAGVIAVLVLAFFFACRAETSDAYDAGYVQAITQAHKRNRESNELEEVALRQRLAEKATVLTTILRRTDTVLAAAPMLPPQTHEDTVQAVVALPKVTAQLFDLRRSCSAFKSTADSTLTSCDSTKASLRVERDDWKGRYEKEHPGGITKRWNAVKFPLGILLGVLATIKLL